MTNSRIGDGSDITGRMAHLVAGVRVSRALPSPVVVTAEEHGGNGGAMPRHHMEDPCSGELQSRLCVNKD